MSADREYYIFVKTKSSDKFVQTHSRGVCGDIAKIFHDERVPMKWGKAEIVKFTIGDNEYEDEELRQEGRISIHELIQAIEEHKLLGENTSLRLKDNKYQINCLDNFLENLEAYSRLAPEDVYLLYTISR